MELFPVYQIPGFRQSFAFLGLNYFQQEQFQRAVEYFSKARDQTDTSGFTDNDLHYLLARCSLAQGNFEKAEKYENILRKNDIPAYIPIFLRAERKFLEGNVKEAISLYESIRPAAPCVGLEEIIALARERLQFLDYEKPALAGQAPAYEKADPVYRNYARVICAWQMSGAGVEKERIEPLTDANKAPDARLLKARLCLEAQEYEKTAELLVPDLQAPGLRPEFDLLRIRCDIEQLENFDKCRAELDEFIRENGRERLLQHIDILSQGNANGNTIVFIFFCRLALREVPAEADYQSLENALRGNLKSKTAAYPEKFALRLKAELLELEGKVEQAAAAYLESAKNYYWEGTEKYGEYLYQKCLQLNPGLMECYWYYADATYLNSFTADSANNSVPEKLEEALKIWNAGLQRESPTRECAWAYITGARIYKNRGYRQLSSEKLYRALIFSQAALLSDPGQAAWQPTLAGYFNDLGLSNNAFAITCPSQGANRTDIGFREEFVRSVVDTGDFETAITAIKELIDLNPAGQSYYDSWQAFIYFHQGNYPATIELLKRVLSSKENENDLWCHDLLMMSCWVAGDENGARETSSWIISIENNENYPFRENEPALAKFIAGDVDGAWELVEPVVDNETFETYASTISLLCLLHKNRTADAGAIFERLLLRPLTYPEANELLIILRHVEHYPGFRNWAHFAEVQSFLDDKRCIERIQLRISGIPRKLSAEPESQIEELEWELKNNRQCQKSMPGYVAMKFSIASIFLTQDKWREALGLFKDLLTEKGLFPLRLREITFAVGARINTNEAYWEYINALKEIGIERDEKEERLIRSAANQHLVKYLGLSNIVDSPIAVTPVSIELAKNLVPDEVMADFSKSDQWVLFNEYIPDIRKQFSENCGIELPPLRFTFNEGFQAGEYLVLYHGVPMYSWKVYADHCYCFDASPEELRPLGIGPDDIINENIPLEKKTGAWIPLTSSGRLTGKTVLYPLQVMLLHIHHLMLYDIGLFVNAQKVDELLVSWKKDKTAGQIIDELFQENGPRKKIRLGKIIKQLAKEKVPLNDYTTIVQSLRKSGLASDDVLPGILLIRSDLPSLLRKSDEQREQTLFLDEELERQSLNWVRNLTGKDGGEPGGVAIVLAPPEEVQLWLDRFRKCIPPGIEDLLLIVKDPMARWVVHNLIASEFPRIIVLVEQENKRWKEPVALEKIEAMH